jgi:hypothetical protein
MTFFCLDGSALAKRYVPEAGSVLMDFIMDNVPEDRLYLLNLGFAEVVSVLVRKKNAGTITGGQFGQALLEFEKKSSNRSASTCSPSTIQLLPTRSP